MKIDQTLQDVIQASPEWKIGIVHSTFHEKEINSMVDAAQEVLVKAGLPQQNIKLFSCPGSFEIPLIGREIAEKGEIDALMGFGIIVQGETKHADLLASEVARGMMDIQLRYGMPFAFEVLYVDSLKQAQERATGVHNKGIEAARALLHSLSEIQRIRASNP